MSVLAKLEEPVWLLMLVSSSGMRILSGSSWLFSMWGSVAWELDAFVPLWWRAHASPDCCFSGARLKGRWAGKQIPSRELLTLEGFRLVPRSLAVLKSKRGEVQSVGLMHEITDGTCLLWMWSHWFFRLLWYNRHIGWRRILLFKIFIYLFWLS